MQPIKPENVLLLTLPTHPIHPTGVRVDMEEVKSGHEFIVSRHMVSAEHLCNVLLTRKVQFEFLCLRPNHGIFLISDFHHAQQKHGFLASGTFLVCLITHTSSLSCISSNKIHCKESFTYINIVIFHLKTIHFGRLNKQLKKSDVDK